MGKAHFDLNHNLNRPVIKNANGSKYWRIYALFHNLNGPAVEYSAGSKCWRISDIKIDPYLYKKLKGK